MLTYGDSLQVHQESHPFDFIAATLFSLVDSNAEKVIKDSNGSEDEVTDSHT